MLELVQFIPCTKTHQFSFYMLFVYLGYDIDTNAGTANSVATAAMRFVASLMPSTFVYYNRNLVKLVWNETASPCTLLNWGTKKTIIF